MPTIYKPKKKENRTIQKSERMKIYNSARWRELRTIKLINNPLCERCEKKGLTVAAEDIHHIDSFTKYEGNQRLYVAYDYNNLESLCKKCHQLEHNGKDE